MSQSRWNLVVFTFALAVLPLWAVDGLAQTQDRTWIGLNPYVGILLLDDSELKTIGREINIAPLVGLRFSIAPTRSWVIDAGYGFAPAETEVSQFNNERPEEKADLHTHLLYGAVNYVISSKEAPTRLILVAGVGAAFFDLETSDSSDSQFMFNLGLGFTHPVGEWIIFRGDFKDHITFCRGPTEITDTTLCVSDATMNNLEFSGGLVFLLN